MYFGLDSAMCLRQLHANIEHLGHEDSASSDAILISPPGSCVSHQKVCMYLILPGKQDLLRLEALGTPVHAQEPPLSCHI